jgi:ribosomal protein S24E
MTEGAVVVKTRKFKRNPLLSRRQVCVAKDNEKEGKEKTPWRTHHNL